MSTDLLREALGDLKEEAGKLCEQYPVQRGEADTSEDPGFQDNGLTSKQQTGEAMRMVMALQWIAREPPMCRGGLIPAKERGFL